MQTNNEKRLGRGLQDMMRDADLPSQLESIQKDASRARQKIRIEELHVNPFQPRVSFDEDKLQELAESITEHGIFTPLLVRLHNNRYEIVAGERRFRAAKIAGLQEVPVIVEEFDDNTMMEIALIENIQRDNLNALEEAQAYDKIMKAQNLTQQVLARKIGKTRPYIANVLRLLNLPKEVQNMVASGKISSTAARPLIGLTNQQIIEMADKIQKEKLNVRQIEEQVKKLKKKETVNHDEEVTKLGNYLLTGVSIDNKFIKIQYYDENHLQEILKKIIK